MNLSPVNLVTVTLEFGSGPFQVGRLALRDRWVYFEYEPGFLAQGLEISPLHLPLRPGLQRFDKALFEGLPGVFNDSLPDGWGRLLLDRVVRARGLLPAQLSPLDRLCHVGRGGMGALCYAPAIEATLTGGLIDLDQRAGQAREVLAGQADEVLGELLALNGSSAGARPKVLVDYDPASGRMSHGSSGSISGLQPWLVKFANGQDGVDSGAIEYVYSLMARAAGVAMTETRLLPARTGPGFFATRRFDRCDHSRLHVHTASGLLHADHRAPCVDYEDLLGLTLRLTGDVREVTRVYRLAVFNVLAHNRDDHAKTFSFLTDAAGQWTFAPAYDLSFSSGPGAEQSTLVKGEGRSPGTTQLLELARDAGLSRSQAQDIIDQTRDALAGWRRLAREHGVRAHTVQLISERLRAIA